MLGVAFLEEKQKITTTNSVLNSIHQERRAAVAADIKACYKQLSYTSSEVEQTRIQRQIDSLVSELEELNSKNKPDYIGVGFDSSIGELDKDSLSHGYESFQMELALKLLACPSIRDAARRESVIRWLPNDIKDNIESSSTPKGYALNIIKASMEQPNGLQSLIKLLEFFDKGTFAFNNFKALVEAKSTPMAEPIKPLRIQPVDDHPSTKGWKEKKAYLESQLSMISDPGMKFSVKKQIEECEEEINKLNLEMFSLPLKLKEHEFVKSKILSTLSHYDLTWAIKEVLPDFNTSGQIWSVFERAWEKLIEDKRLPLFIYKITTKSSSLKSCIFEKQAKE